MLRAAGVSAFALTAGAFLLPPNIPSTADIHKGAENTLEGLSWLNSHHVGVELYCPDCLYAKANGDGTGYTWVPDTENSLGLDFSVPRDGRSIELNRVPFYPLRTLPNSMHASQILTDSALRQVFPTAKVVQSPPLRLSYELGFAEPIIVKEDTSQLHKIRFHILAIGDQSVDVNEVILTAHEDLDGQFTILDVTTVPHTPTKATNPVATDDKECKNLSPLFCKWKAILEAKLNDVKSSINKTTHGRPRPGCHRRPRPLVPGSLPSLPPHGFPRPINRHPHHGQPHKGPNALSHTLRRVAVTVLIPILIGVAAGMMASLLGMIVGSAIGYLWIRFRRGGRRAPCARVVILEENSDVPEKERLLVVEDEEAPPPEYVEKDGLEGE